MGGLNDAGDAHARLSALIVNMLEEDPTPLSSHLGQMGEVSLFNYMTALSAVMAGIGGRIIVDLPNKRGGRIEVDWRPTSPIKGRRSS